MARLAARFCDHSERALFHHPAIDEAAFRACSWPFVPAQEAGAHATLSPAKLFSLELVSPTIGALTSRTRIIADFTQFSLPMLWARRRTEAVIAVRAAVINNLYTEMCG
jgi:hypothetical protein